MSDSIMRDAFIAAFGRLFIADDDKEDILLFHDSVLFFESISVDSDTLDNDSPFPFSSLFGTEHKKAGDKMLGDP